MRNPCGSTRFKGLLLTHAYRFSDWGLVKSAAASPAGSGVPGAVSPGRAFNQLYQGRPGQPVLIGRPVGRGHAARRLSGGDGMSLAYEQKASAAFAFGAPLMFQPSPGRLTAISRAAGTPARTTPVATKVATKTVFAA